MHRHKNTLTGMHTLWILNRNLVPYTCTRWARVQSNTKGLFLAWDGSIWHTPESEPWHMFLNAHLDRVSIRRPECERASYICSTVRRWIVLSCICLSVHVHELAMLNQYACLCDWVHGWVWKSQQHGEHWGPGRPCESQNTFTQSNADISVSPLFTHSVCPSPFFPSMSVAEAVG